MRRLLTHCIRPLTVGARGRARKPRGGQRNATRPQFELLEYRVTPARLWIEVTGLGEGGGTIDTNHAGTQSDPVRDTTLRGAVSAAGAFTYPVTIFFDPSLFTSGPQTLTLSQVGDGTAGPSDLGISTSIAIAGPSGDSGLTLLNSGVQRLFYVGATGSLTLQDLTLTGGEALGAPSDPGGGAAGVGGAVFNAAGTATITNSTLTANAAAAVAYDIAASAEREAQVVA